MKETCPRRILHILRFNIDLLIMLISLSDFYERKFWIRYNVGSTHSLGIWWNQGIHKGETGLFWPLSIKCCSWGGHFEDQAWCKLPSNDMNTGVILYVCKKKAILERNCLPSCGRKNSRSALTCPLCVMKKWHKFPF